MPSYSTRKKPLSGAARARQRVALGLPRYTPSEIASRARTEAKRSKRRYQEKYARRSAYIDGIKLAAGCADCGYNNHPAALQFDHLPGTEKIGIIAHMRGNTSIAILNAEIAKCEVVCANCHAIRTAQRRVAADYLEKHGK